MTSYGQYCPDMPIIPILFIEIMCYYGTIWSPAKFVFIWLDRTFPALPKWYINIPKKTLAGMSSYGQYCPEMPVIMIFCTETVCHDPPVWSPAKLASIPFDIAFRKL